MAITGKTLKRNGWTPGPLLGIALEAAKSLEESGMDPEEILRRLDAARSTPAEFVSDAALGALAREIASTEARRAALPELRPEPIDFALWGTEGLDDHTLAQMALACRLPITAAAAQMPDGHVGYGLPIGGVLATRNAVIPYAVGVDIACRMKLSIVDIPAGRLDGLREKLKNALTRETRFGMGAHFRGRDRRDHAVMDDPAWEDLPPPLRALKDKAWAQLGTSGSGNHFVEWGILRLPDADLDLPAGEHLALLSHSGSRGLGAQTCGYYTDLAREESPLPREAMALSWLSLDGAAGREYWTAMELAGRYAAANHALIHKHVAAAAGAKIVAGVENHHNFAWIEEHNGEQLVVHRKGATPAGAGVLGVIPGSMADPGFVVRGRGVAASLDSAAHGAGRRMSRKAAKQSLTKTEWKAYLAERGVELLSAGIDEAPMAYKPIREVMAAQADLVDIVGEFHPRIVLMADGGPAED